jgi:glycosyltransferase involved in cell wall biosynthesis
MKICIFSSVHLALDNRIFYREARSLHKGGYNVNLIAIHDKTEIRDGIQIIGLPEIPRWKRPFIWLKVINITKNIKADIYHFHDPELLFVSPFIKILTKKPVIYDVHESYPDFIKVKDYMPIWIRYPIAWLFRWIEPLLSRLQNGLIFSDDNIALSFDGIPVPKITLFNFPSSEFIEAAQVETKRAKNRLPIIIHLGGHERNRGSRLMIEAFEYVLQKRPDAKLELVGHFMPPDLQYEVQADINKRKLQHAVTITGRVPFDKISEYLKKAAVGWMPWQSYTKNEKNIPTKLFEYMAYGLPIVSSSLNSTRPFIKQGENGFLVTPNNPREHAEAILTILNDEILRDRLGRNGQEIVYTKYNWDEMEIRLLEFYSNLTSNRS